MKARGLIAVAFALAGGLGASIFFIQRHAHSADHLDSPATKADATMDINDVYEWMDGNNAVFAMTLFPLANTSSLFSDTAQYVLHTTSTAAYGVASTHQYDIICTFSGTTSPQTTTCWAGTNDYVTGNASATTGITSADGKFKVFAGLRSDPFFFNLAGFNATVADVEAAGALPTNDAGCPTLPGATALALVTQLATAPDGGAPADFFAGLNALAIVVSIDKSLVTSGGSIVSVWASTLK